MARRQHGARRDCRCAGNNHHLRHCAIGSEKMKLDLYTRFYLWLVAHRRWVLGVTLLIAAVSVVISLRIDLEEDILAMLPQRDRLVDEYRYALRKFRQIDRVYLDVGINADDPDKLAAAADEVFSALSTNTAYLDRKSTR